MKTSLFFLLITLFSSSAMAVGFVCEHDLRSSDGPYRLYQVEENTNKTYSVSVVEKYFSRAAGKEVVTKTDFTATDCRFVTANTRIADCRGDIGAEKLILASTQVQEPAYYTERDGSTPAQVFYHLKLSRSTPTTASDGTTVMRHTSSTIVFDAAACKVL